MDLGECFLSKVNLSLFGSGYFLDHFDCGERTAVECTLLGASFAVACVGLYCFLKDRQLYSMLA